MKPETCPHCHQPMRGTRLGVYLSPRRAEIFDMIRAAGDGGISCDGLAERLRVSHHTVRSHVLQINDLLAETDWKITRFPGGNSPDNAYELVRREPGD
jgi:DNA-binding CsgD family transcriptional regulator